MKPSDIKPGKTYTNRGAGQTRRKVLAIGDAHRPIVWRGNGTTLPPEEPGVWYKQHSGKNKVRITYGNLYLSSFAAWVGEEVA